MFYKTNSFKVCHSVEFSVLTALCTPHLYPVPEHSHRPQRKPRPIQQSFPSPSVCVLLAALHIAHQWNPTTRDLLRLASFA